MLYCELLFIALLSLELISYYDFYCCSEIGLAILWLYDRMWHVCTCIMCVCVRACVSCIYMYDILTDVCIIIY